MKERDLTKINIPNYSVKAGAYRRPKEDKEVIGWDSETYRGKITILANSKGDYLIPDSMEDILGFINNPTYKKAYNFFFNLEYDTNAFIKHLPDKNILNLIAYNKTVYLNHKIKIIPKKLLSILPEGKKRFTLKFFDISQFYHYGSLAKTYKEVFNELYEKRVSEEKRKAGFKKEEITPDDIKYCIEDSIICKKLAENFINLTNQIIYVPRYISPASISKAFLKSKLEQDYTFSPSELQQYALNSYQGGRFECLKRGYFDRIYTYDINSCYPYFMYNLPFPIGNQVGNKKYESESIYSYFKVNLKIRSDLKISPMKYFFPKKNFMIYPTGTFKNVFLTKGEYDLMKKYDSKIEIIDAKHLFNDNPQYPYYWVKELYDIRKKLKKENNPLEHIIKLIINSGYGIHIQLNKITYLKEHWDIKEEKDYNNELIDYNNKVFLKTYKWLAGQFFNPIIATEITSRARVKLIEDSERYSKNVIMFATDSITFDKKVNLSLSDNMGDYEIEDKGLTYGVVVGNGVYQIVGNKEQKKRFRGFTRDYNLIDILKKNKNKKVIKLTKNKPTKLKESRTNLDTLNIFRDYERQLNINSDKKRNWERSFLNGNDVLNNQIDSKALEIAL